jgi:hypothetical protein
MTGLLTTESQIISREVPEPFSIDRTCSIKVDLMRPAFDQYIATQLVRHVSWT